MNALMKLATPVLLTLLTLAIANRVAPVQTRKLLGA